MSDCQPLGPPCDPTPRPLPIRHTMTGAHVILEPLLARHTEDLWREAQGFDDSWAYLKYGPFPDPKDFLHHIQTITSQHEPMLWAVRRVDTGRAAGFLGLTDIQPLHAAIEIGHVWFGPSLKRSRAATEALYLVMRATMDDLGYRRLHWKCHNLNEASHRAARRLGFEFEGVLRAHWVVKGRRRDSAFYSILDDEWPVCAAAIRAWLADENFSPDGAPLQSLETIRAAILQRQQTGTPA